MSDSLEALKTELEQFGETNDAATTERSRRMLNITRDTGEFLSVLVRATGARRILEIGTSNGYSTLWLAEAAMATGGTVTTVELSEQKIALAAATFARSGLASSITLVHDDAGHLLRSSADSAFDFIFLDSERTAYPTWWPQLRHALRPGGLLVVDNAISPASAREELTPFVAIVKADPLFTTSLVPVGKGEFVAVKASS
jgi:predicted O-methyltransferase YrrM